MSAGGEGGGGEQASPYWSTFSSTSAPLSSPRTRSRAREAAAPKQPAGRGVRASPHDAHRCFQRAAAEAVLLRTPSTAEIERQNYAIFILKFVTVSNTPTGLDLNLDLPRYQPLSPGDRGKKRFQKYAAVEGDSSRWRSRIYERNGGPVLRPPHNGNKIR
eukprot:6179359-Pleurochrysis_carterae.AAC.1